MTTRVFRAPSLISAREAALSALGEDAVILTTREVKRPGLFGLFGATEVEVAAAVPPRAPPTKTMSTGPFASEAYATTNATASRGTDASNRAAVVNALRADLRSEIRAVKAALGRGQAAEGASTTDLAAEVFAMRSTLEQFAPPAPKGRRLATLLKSRGIEGRAAAELSRAVKGLPESEIQNGLRQHLEQTLSVAAWPLPTPGKRSLIAAVGMSGVGKTTTLAKLATLARAAKMRVTLVTCDTFRVGGVEQLQRYAKLLDASFETVRSIEDFEAVLEDSDSDVVILDTSGRPSMAGAPEQLLREEAFARSAACRAFERHVLLCLPASAREVDVPRSLATYGFAQPNALAFTKLDETLHPSGIVHAAAASRLPIALTCSGPRVPEDLMATDIKYIVDQVFPATDSRTKARAA